MLYNPRILDRRFNVAVCAIASRLFPGGYDIGECAPETYDQLKQHLNAGNRMIVYSGGSDKTIYGCPHANYSFRAWHDWCHWKGKHDFSSRGEAAVYKMQCDHLNLLYGSNDLTDHWCNILYAEVIEQNAYFDRTGQFPDDQLSFVENYLNTLTSPQ